MSKVNVAKNVLLPGDPKRAEYISKRYLSNVEKIDEEHGINGYTGIYAGKELSVIGSGMGIPSVLLAANTLYDYYDVETIIRIGTCGTAQEGVNIGDILIALGCSTTSGINRNTFDDRLFCPVADFKLLSTAVEVAREIGVNVKVGNLLSTDLFYELTADTKNNLWWDFGVLGVEMEGAGLYTEAMKYNRKALMICTVSDSIITRVGMTPKQRETTLHDMITLGLNTIEGFSC